MTDSTLFPLPLSPFEVYMVVDDGTQYRMTFIMRLDFTGSADIDALRRALAMALARHPLLTAHLDRSTRKWQWQAGHPEASLEIINDRQTIDFQHSEPIDLAIGHGVRFLARIEGEQVQLAGEFHHAVSDGIGAAQFFGDWLAAYHSLITGEAPCWSPLDPQQLTTRGNLRWPPPPHPITFSQALRGSLSEVVKWMTRFPVMLQAPRKPKAETSATPTLLVHSFTEEQTTELRNRAKAQQVTVNDLLLRDLFLAMDAWNRQHGAGERGWLQINMPTSLRRGRSDDEMPAANVIGYAFLARRPRDCRQPEQLLQSLARDTKAIRAWGLGNFFLDGVRKAARWPMLMQWFARPGRCLATAVLSNLGDPQRRMNARLPRSEGRLRAGELVLQRLTGVPPLRSGTRLTCLATTCAGELTLSLLLDARYFSPADSADFLDLWLRYLGMAAGSARQPTAAISPSKA